MHADEPFVHHQQLARLHSAVSDVLWTQASGGETQSRLVNSYMGRVAQEGTSCTYTHNKEKSGTPNKILFVKPRQACAPCARHCFKSALHLELPRVLGALVLLPSLFTNSHKLPLPTSFLRSTSCLCQRPSIWRQILAKKSRRASKARPSLCCVYSHRGTGVWLLRSLTQFLESNNPSKTSALLI